MFGLSIGNETTLWDGRCSVLQVRGCIYGQEKGVVTGIRQTVTGGRFCFDARVALHLSHCVRPIADASCACGNVFTRRL